MLQAHKKLTIDEECPCVILLVQEIFDLSFTSINRAQEFRLANGFIYFKTNQSSNK
jgi:hypothetical protein